MFYVYVLKCRDSSLYTGYTTDVENRIKQHELGKAAKYTRSRLPVKLVLSLKYFSKSEAMKAEIAFKKLNRKDKLERIKQFKTVN